LRINGYVCNIAMRNSGALAVNEDDRDIFRVAIMKNGVKSSISMDGQFAHYLQLKLGSEDRVRSWVRETATRLEREWSEAAVSAEAGQRVRANTGLSRAIQREALDELLRGVSFTAESIGAESH